LSYLTDALGSVIRLNNEAGAKVVDYTYEPYGKTTADAVNDNPIQYTGRENDGATGFYYYRARYYSPLYQRFISEDPIGLAGGINKYAYVEGDPVLFSDPMGLVCTYSQSTGVMSCRDNSGNEYARCVGYAGNGDGVNNPALEGVQNVGPLPRGRYTIGEPRYSSNTGRNARNLTPDPANNMYGRSNFQWHGANADRDRGGGRNSSNGCIVTPPDCRLLPRSGEVLDVVP
jgi:RHS repeat-associated protein